MSEHTDATPMFECPAFNWIATARCGINRRQGRSACLNCDIPTRLAQGEVPTMENHEFLQKRPDRVPDLRRVLDHIARMGPSSVSELAGVLQLDLATTERRLREWQQDGRLEQTIKRGEARWSIKDTSPPPATTSSRKAPTPGAPSQSDRIRGALAKAPTGLTVQDIADLTDVPVGNIAALLSQLRTRGEVSSDGRRPATYKLADGAARPALPKQHEPTFPPMGSKPEGTGQHVVKRRNNAEAPAPVPAVTESDALGGLMEYYRARALMDLRLADAVLPLDPNWPSDLKAKHERIRAFVIQELER